MISFIILVVGDFVADWLSFHMLHVAACVLVFFIGLAAYIMLE